MIHKLRGMYILLLLAVFSLPLSAQSIPSDSLYLGQLPPGKTPKVFAPGIISISGRNDKVITFSPDGQCLFYSVGDWPNCITMFMEYKNGHWTNPDTASFSQTRSVDEPLFAPDGKRVYYYAYNAPNSVGGADICYSVRNDSLWSDPINVGSSLNSSLDEYHPCIVHDSSIYFENNSGLMHRSQYTNGTYQSRIPLPSPINPNSAYGDPYISPDESYIIISSSRSGGYGGKDIYISYKKVNGAWTNPKNLGNTINTSVFEDFADITPDGKYMTFGRNEDIYWVSASFIDSLRHTNFIPYLKWVIANQVDTVGHLFRYTIPDTTFIDDDGNNTLSYSATLNNGSSLPVWLSFDSTDLTFSGTPTAAGTYTIKVTTFDTAKASASTTFNLIVSPLTGVAEGNNSFPESFSLGQNYPNPFNPTTIIRYQLPVASKVKLIVYNLLGQKIKTLIDSFQSAGEHSLVWDATDDKNRTVSSGVYFYKMETNKMSYQKKMLLAR